MALSLPLHGVSVGDSLLVYCYADRKWYSCEIIEVSGDHDCEILYEDGERDRISLDQIKFIVRRNWTGSIRERKKRGDDSLQTIKNILFDMENTVMRRSSRLQKKGLTKCIPIPCSNQREGLSEAPCLSIQSPLCSDEIRSYDELSSDSLSVSASSQPHDDFDRKYSADRPLVRARHRATIPKKRKQSLVHHLKVSRAKRSRRSCLPHQIEYSNGIAGDGGENQKVGLYGLSGRMLCSICQIGVAENFMLRCVGIGCFCAFHTFCLYPPLQRVPKMDWLCPYCKDDPLFTGMMTEDRKLTPKKIGSIIGRRRIVINRKKNVLQDQFLIKWELFSHHHDSWVPMEWVKLIDRVRMHRFQDKNPVVGDGFTVIDPRKAEWFKIDRVIACRRKFNAHNVCEILNLSQASQDSREFEFLVKWMGLDYSDVTWESSCMEELLTEIGKLVHRHQRAIERSDNYCWESHVPQLDVQPSYLKGGILFDYQMRGLNWILNNFISRRNVILADEMGLGKTVQVVSFVHCMMQEKLTGNPVLIVAPKNILFHWGKEFCHWAEELNVVIYQGERASRRCIQDYEFFASGKVLFDVLITNYELILSDNHVLRKFKWSAIIIDEAHKLKNLDCKLGRCLKQYTTDFRLLLTGTPLQNTLLELFALLHFLDPEEFFDPRAKAESFSNIGMGLADGKALDYDTKISQIHELLRPRMLRRMKLDVLPRLIPAKKWVEVPCALTNIQRVLYINLLTKNYEELNKGIHSGRKITLNFLLMELRKCCNHPYLFPGQELGEVPVSLVASSGKLQLLQKLLPKLKERGNRVLLFSQMTKMLDILEDFLLFLGLAYFRIDGNTSMSARQQQMKEFNSPESTVFIFLISTRAGGLGIDLPSADRVIIYDPDFNPFMDLQAQSRAHRIGQTRPVVVYQLITKCSVEEKILQKSKKKLAVENMVMNPTKKLKVDELQSVLLHGARKILSKKFTHATSIHYDDKAIETLLELDPAPADKCTPEENDYLGAIESFVAGSENKELPPSPKAQEWQEIFGPIKDLGKSEKLGRGKRQRKDVKYVYDDGSDSDSDDIYSSDSTSVETSSDSSSGYESEDLHEDI
ncbi:CHD3-type chromatin-remodeling factor PICKLE-like [Magnolia sinica]|uniref:CHD3-type chromatin-remodeling factor PICKLE-like n=1 Tax=Magnolia sinica TaxID=86752 RepID=UPI002659F295|nr:CHD3-type chromatin-remodeling factor PICKLE-like [Magnolia sinica]